jgi:hypothetical protein
VVALVLAGCEPAQPAQAPTPGATAKGHAADAAPSTTKVERFSIDAENLSVDRVSMRDGALRADGNRDLVFRATVDGPVDALFLVTTSDRGQPSYGFRADTIVGHEELPAELGSVIDVGRLTVWIAVVEDGKFINSENGTLGLLGPGRHDLKLYVPNPGNLMPPSYLRLYARAPGGVLAASPVIPY